MVIFMNKNYIPTWHCTKAINIDVDKIQQLGFKVVFCDIDNTLVSPFVKKPTQDVIDFVNKFKEKDIKFILISNNNEKRVKEFATDLDVEYIFKSKKPNPKKMLAFIEKLNVEKKYIVSIGDQIMTDVLCANRAQISVILVDKLEKKEQLITFFPRRLDIFFRKRLKKKNLLKEF